MKAPLEKHLQDACCDLLALDGWRRIRTDLKHLRGMGVQEKGMADDLFIRYRFADECKAAITLIEDFGQASHSFSEHQMRAFAEILWVEWKSKRGVHGQKQDEWQLLERTRGALVWVAKKDFEPTVEGFQAHYAASGLLRNQGLRCRKAKVIGD